MSALANALRRAIGAQEENDPNMRGPTYHQRKVLARNTTDALKSKQNPKPKQPVHQSKRA